MSAHFDIPYTYYGAAHSGAVVERTNFSGISNVLRVSIPEISIEFADNAPDIVPLVLEFINEEKTLVGRDRGQKPTSFQFTPNAVSTVCWHWQGSSGDLCLLLHSMSNLADLQGMAFTIKDLDGNAVQYRRCAIRFVFVTVGKPVGTQVQLVRN